MEKRLSLTIDSSSAKKGANDLNSILGKLEKKAKTITKALGDLGNVEKFANSVGKTGDKTSKAAKQTDDYTLAVSKAEKAIQANYHSVRLLNGETGKELELSRKMVTNKKLEFEASSKEAQAINAATAKTKAYTKVQNDLLKTKEKLALVNTKEYKELQKLRRELESSEKAAKGLDDQSRKLQRTMMGVGIAASMFSGTMIIQDLIQTADAYTELQNKIAVVTGSTQGLVQTTDELVRVSFNARTSVAATTDLYSKLNRVNKEYGYTQQEILVITETVSKAVAMSGASAQAAEGAVIQFAQALSGDFKTSGQELNSILEQTPGLAEALAKGLTEVGDIGEVTASRLKKLASEGLIDTKDVLEGLAIVAPEVSRLFELSTGTIAQSLGNLSDAFTNSFGKFDKANDLSKNLTDGINLLTESLLESQKALGGLVGFMTGGAILAIGGTAAALASLIGAVPLLAGTAFLGLATGIGVLMAEVEESAAKIRELSEELKDLDQTLAGIRTKEQASNLLESTLGDLDGIDAEIDRFEKAQKRLEGRLSKEDVGGRGREVYEERLQEVNNRIEVLYKNRKDLQEQTDKYLAIVQGTMLPPALEDGSDKEAANLKRLTRQVEELNASLLTPKEKAIVEFKKAMDLLADAADAGVDNVKITEAAAAAHDKLQKALTSSKGKVAELGDSYDKLRASLQANIETFGKSDLEIAIYTNRMKTAENTEADYAAQLKQGLVTREQVDKAVKQNQDNIEELTKDYYDLIHAKKTEAAMDSVTGNPISNFFDGIDKARKEGINEFGMTPEQAEEYAAQFARQSADGISQGISDALTSGDTNNLIQSFGDLLGDTLSQSIGGSITKSLTSSIGAAGAGLFGAIGGSIVGVLASSMLSPRKTTQTGTGYNVNVSGGAVTNAFTTKSFKKEGSLLLSSRSWTEYEKLSIGAMDSLNNSFALANNTLTRQADNLGITVDNFSGKLSEKNGNIGESIESFSDKTVDASFAAIESFQYMGESFVETFTRLSEQAETLSDAFRATGRGTLGVIDDQWVNNYATQLSQSYEQRISSLNERADEVYNERLNNASYETFVGGGRGDQGYYRTIGLDPNSEAARKQAEQAREDFLRNADISELYSRLADVHSEAAAEFSDRLKKTVSELNNVSMEDAANKFAELTNSFLENYYSQQERLQIAADNISADFRDMNVQGINLSTTGEELRSLYENASSPERIAEILSAAKAISDYNEVIDELSGSVGNFVGSFSDALTRAFDKLVSEIDNLASSVDNTTRLMQRQRAEQALQNALTEAQATGSVTVTEELRNALSIIQKPSEELYSDYASYMRSLGTSANIIDQLRDYGSVPQFATGGYHSGGMRLVGEQGAEMEVTGSSRIFSAQETRNMFDIRPLVQEIASLRSDLRATQMQLVKNSSKSNSDLSRIREDVNRMRQVDESNLFN